VDLVPDAPQLAELDPAAAAASVEAAASAEAAAVQAEHPREAVPAAEAEADADAELVADVALAADLVPDAQQVAEADVDVASPVYLGGAATPAARALDGEIEDRAAAAAAQTAALLARFRPGQSIDDALDEYEAEHGVERAEEPRRAATEVPAEVAIEQPGIPFPAPAPEPVVAAEPSDDVESPEPGLLPADRVGQPAWHIVAPDTTPRAADGHPAEAPATPPAAPPPPAGPPQWPASPQWPATPQWPTAGAEGDRLAALLSTRRPAAEDVWAASSRDILAAPRAPGGMTGGVQSCVSCGLSLSSTARFCRRCGTRQG
jgi:hypothetical protein